MKGSISRFASAAAVLLGAALLAPAPTMAGQAPAAGPDRLVIDCATKLRPSQVAVARSLEIDNVSEAYAARSRLMGEVHRACHRKGTTHVQVVIAPSRKRATPPMQVAMAPAANVGTPR